jgi:hypothetical protein
MAAAEVEVGGIEMTVEVGSDQVRRLVGIIQNGRIDDDLLPLGLAALSRLIQAGGVDTDTWDAILELCEMGKDAKGVPSDVVQIKATSEELIIAIPTVRVPAPVAPFTAKAKRPPQRFETPKEYVMTKAKKYIVKRSDLLGKVFRYSTNAHGERELVIKGVGPKQLKCHTTDGKDTLVWVQTEWAVDNGLCKAHDPATVLGENISV